MHLKADCGLRSMVLIENKAGYKQMAFLNVLI